MYMGGAILGQAGRMTGEAKYFDDAAKQVLQMSKYLWVPEARLFTHATNTVSGEYQPNYYWGRANGWCLMEMAELLTVLPENHPQRSAVLKQFHDRATLADPLTPAEFAAFMAKDMATWAEVVKATGTKPGT